MRNFYVEISGHGSECRSSERPKVALVHPITVSRYNDALKFEDAKITSSRQSRLAITYRLVAQSCWLCGLHANTRKATLKQKHTS